LIEQCLHRFGQIDALIAGTGTEVGVLGPIESADLRSWRAQMEDNFFAALTLIQAGLPSINERPGGGGLCLNTTARRKPFSGFAGVAASKAALACATGYLAHECGKWGIGVNSVYLGWVWGPATASGIEGLAQKLGTTVAELKSNITENIPLGYIPEEA